MYDIHSGEAEVLSVHEGREFVGHQLSVGLCLSHERLSRVNGEKEEQRVFKSIPEHFYIGVILRYFGAETESGKRFVSFRPARGATKFLE